MPGTSRRNDGLHIERTGLAVLTSGGDGRPTDNPQYQPNPPYNLYGEHIELAQTGNVGFTARLANIEGSATLMFASGPPIRRDENITRRTGFDVILNDPADNTKGIIRLWDEQGKANDVAMNLSEAVTAADVAVSQTDRGLHIVINGQEQLISAQPLKNQVWFGFDASNSWDLQALHAYPAKSNEVKQVDAGKNIQGTQAPDGLYGRLAAHGHKDKQIGTAVDLAELLANPMYTEFVLENFNAIETETMAKLQAWQPEEGKFAFGELDALVSFANEHGLEIHGHCLVFTEAYPEWVFNKLRDPSVDKLKVLEQTIKPIVERYNGKNGHGLIRSWDVVNEPFDPDEWGELNKQSIWYKALGEGYIAEAFKMAHTANPDATLFMNDWGAETDADRQTVMRNSFVTLKAQGVPIHGIGLQAHIDEETLSDDDAMDELLHGGLTTYFADIKQEGGLVRISEASVAENGDPEMQGKVYEALLRAALQADNCVGINLWGVTNSEYRNAYFTGDITTGDTGDDAPTNQDAGGKIIPKVAWNSLLAVD
jgi:endo-1,4-beta-xylanase